MLIEELKNENAKVALHAANSLECIGTKAKPALTALKIAAQSEDKYVARAAKYTLSKFEKGDQS